jgi:hypothetical protein
MFIRQELATGVREAGEHEHGADHHLIAQPARWNRRSIAAPRT